MFLLQCTGRSGSTFLRSLLASHPDIEMRGEFLGPDPARAKWGFYAYWAARIAEDHTAISPLTRTKIVADYLGAVGSSRILGLDHKLEHLDRDPWIAPPVYAAADHVIILVRTNLLKQFLSFALMQARIRDSEGTVHGAQPARPRRIRAEPRIAIAHMRDRARLVSEYRAVAEASGKPCLNVVYEDLLTERRADVLHQIQQFLGVSPHQLSSNLVKQNPQAVEEIVENYDELAAAMARTEFAYTLHLPT